MMIGEGTQIYQLLVEHPEAEEVFRKYGISCFG